MIFWIASYPKSGNTWLRALLTSYYFSKDGNFNQLLLKNISQFPDKQYFSDFNYNPKIVTDTSRFWIAAQEKINLGKRIRFFKTHNMLGSINGNNFTNKKNTIGCIYIVRDPRNVITSFKNHYDFSYEEALAAMLNENYYIFQSEGKNDYGNFQLLSSWEKNFQSWKAQKIFPIKLIRYEDLLNQTFNTFKETIEFINKIFNLKNSFQKLKAQKSIQSTTFLKLKSMEKKEGFVESIFSKKENKKIPFFHLGAENDWKKILDKDHQTKLNSQFQASLKELQYI
ncbi:MAG: sulfotransferase [Pelagibacteraceae bacterium]|nr:MAG: sulfotransferase [Pelagibacteraceae bacterium]